MERFDYGKITFPETIMESDFCTYRYALATTFHTFGYKSNFQIKMLVIFAYSCQILGLNMYQIR